MIGDPQVVELLIEALVNNDSNVRFAAARALGKIVDPQAVEPLIEALGDNDELVQGAARGSLIAIVEKYLGEEFE